MNCVVGFSFSNLESFPIRMKNDEVLCNVPLSKAVGCLKSSDGVTDAKKPLFYHRLKSRFEIKCYYCNY